jgi:hypothetical protein
MQKHYMDLIVKEVKNFDKLKEKYDYADIDDLIAHYIEEQVIISEAELLDVINIIRLKLGKVIDPSPLWNGNE